MLPFYLFSAILGGGLLLVAIFGGHDGAAESHDLDIGLDDAFAGTDWNKALSLRTLAYSLAAFGLTGTGLRMLNAEPAVTFALAVLMGLSAWTFTAVLFRWLQRNEGGFGERSTIYIGGIGRTEIRIPSDGRGRIELLHRGRAFTLPAVSLQGEIERQETVIVVDVVDGVAVVDRAPSELLS
jgi:membrane protein implicated in regulation of membrane protease activity